MRDMGFKTNLRSDPAPSSHICHTGKALSELPSSLRRYSHNCHEDFGRCQGWACYLTNNSEQKLVSSYAFIFSWWMEALKRSARLSWMSVETMNQIFEALCARARGNGPAGEVLDTISSTFECHRSPGCVIKAQAQPTSWLCLNFSHSGMEEESHSQLCLNFQMHAGRRESSPICSSLSHSSLFLRTLHGWSTDRWSAKPTFQLQETGKEGVYTKDQPYGRLGRLIALPNYESARYSGSWHCRRYKWVCTKSTVKTTQKPCAWPWGPACLSLQSR